MTHTQSRKRLAVVLIVFAVIIAGVCLKPWYDRYIENDHLSTCRQARLVIVDRYNRAVQAQLDAGTPADQIDYDAVLLAVIHENFPEAEVTPYEEVLASDPGAAKALRSMSIGPDPAHTFVVRGICRSGGTYTAAVDPLSRRADTWCDYCSGDIIHGEYNFGFKPFETE